MRLIDAETLGLELKVSPNGYLYVTDNDIINSPTVDAEPTVHAHWIEEMWGDGWNEWTDLTCSACREKFKKFIKTKRCPNCGAKMDEVGK